jgi:D-glycero-D-manno-heptose 1,7-bisphosphate phosphatase
MRRALFLDRDGVINKEVNYLHKIEDFEILPGVVPVLKTAQQKGFLIIIVTNQAGIAKGYYTEEEYRILEKHIENFFKKEGVHIDATYFCPHHPDGKGKYKRVCDCRKPGIGMIQQAAQDFGEIDFSQSILVGDKESDIESGINAGIGRVILVRSGHAIDEDNTLATEIIDGLGALCIS